MGDSDKFVLRWNDFEKNIVGAYKDLRSDKNFQDVTLACQGGTFSAHRVILSACSPVLLGIIREVTHHHPVLYMRGVKAEDMAALLDFMYHGQANVAETELERFLSVASELQVRGLTGGEQTETEQTSRRVSDVDLHTAVDDDVNSLLAGLDDQPPPAKRVKQEKEVKEEQRSSDRAAQGATLTRQTSTSISDTQVTNLDRMRNLVSITSNPVSASLPSHPPPRYPSSPVRLPLPAQQGFPSSMMRSVPAAVSQAQAQTSPGVFPPLANYQMYPGQPEPRLAHVEHSKDGSPPVLHLPDMPAGGEDQEYQRQIEAYIERGNEKKLSCKTCSKTVSTKNKASLIAHIESVHIKADFKCGSCNKNFKAASYLKQHQKRSGCTGS